MTKTLKLAAAAACWLLVATSAWAQSVQATLSGVVVDDTGAVVPGVQLSVLHLDTAGRRETSSNADGRFSIPFLPPGRYVLRADLKGFDPAQLDGLVFNAGDQAAVTIRIKVAALNERVQVVAVPERVDTSHAVTTVVDRAFVENLPLNGRSLQSLIALAPGVVVTPSSTASPGQFSVNGQRTNANYFTVDGVSANIGVVNDANWAEPPGQEAVGATPGMNAIGGTQNLVSTDALEEFTLQTSTYSAEFGRQPGGQISLATRSGTNTFRGSAFLFGRHDGLDANDWFINARGLPKVESRQLQYGAAAGGPVILPWFGGTRYDGTNRTFFFASYEGLNLKIPRVTTQSVPSMSVRAEAHPAVRPLLNAYPTPTGPEDPLTHRAPFVGSFSDPSWVQAASLRVDHTLSNTGRLFLRYSDGRSSTSTGFLARLESRVNTRTLTAGATSTFGRASNDVRINFSQNNGPNAIVAEEFGAAVPLPYGALGNSQVAIPPTSAFIFTALGNSIGETRGRGYFQRQWNVVDTVAVVLGRHTLRAGVDYRHLQPRGGAIEYFLFVAFNTPESVLTGRLSSGSISVNRPTDVSVGNFSAFVADIWAVSHRLSIDTGLRWDVNPAPGGSYYTVTGLDRLETADVAAPGTPLYPTQWRNIAPRVGASYLLRQQDSRTTVVRGGAGLYYDLGAGVGAQVAGFFPFTTAKLLAPGTPYPLDLATALPPSPLPPDPPFVGQTFVAFAPDYETPRAWQWNSSIEQGLSRSQTLLVSYVGSRGSNLLRRELIRDPNPRFLGSSRVTVTRSNGSSEYQALQVQYRQRSSGGIQTLLNYTLAKSEDTASSDVDFSVRSDLVDAEADRGPSDYDVRHVFSGALTWELPAAGTRWRRALTDGWTVSALVRAQSAAPVNVTVFRDLGFGVFRFRPDLVPGEPLYLHDPSTAGGRRLNPAAFAAPAEPRQGTLQRNSVRGFPLRQLDLSLRREVRIGNARVQFTVDAFNALNTPNFGSPQPLLGSVAGTRFFPNGGFGRSDSMAAAQLGGLNRLYQVGGPRSFQLSTRVSF